VIKKKFLKNCIKELYPISFIDAFPKEDFSPVELKLVEAIVELIKEEKAPWADEVFKKTGDMDVAKLFIELAP